MGTRSARSQFQHIIIGSSQLGPVTRLLHAPDVAADLLRALSRGFAQMSIQQSGLISYDFVTNERMRAVVITKGKSFSLGWNKACTSRLVNGNTQPSAPSTGSINPFSLSPLPKTGASAAHAINRRQPSNPGAACACAARVWDSARHELDHQGRSWCLCVPPTLACAVLAWRRGRGDVLASAHCPGGGPP